MPALYRKYRSGSFSEVVGQPQVTDILEASLKQGKLSHAYLLVGPRGVGKTSVARILAYAINGLEYQIEQSHIDIIEIDAASNTGVDNIRDLIDRAQIAPSLAKKKIYIIDEVHMLSKSAFNAFLKLLEEPPAHVVFILATTDEHKVPATIISRTQKFVFRKISNQAIAQHLAKIAAQEKIEVDNVALEIIAQHSQGAMRDAINLFDQISCLNTSKQKISEKQIRELLGLAPRSELEQLINTYLTGDLNALQSQLAALFEQNFEATSLAQQLAELAQQSLSSHPSLIDLIDKLLRVSRSSSPELSLLLSLAQNACPTSDFKPTTDAVLNSKQTSPAATKSDNELPNSDFDATKLLGECQTHHLAVFGLLSKSKLQLDGQTLLILVPNSFALKRLSSPKYQAELQQALIQADYPNLVLKIELDQYITKQKAANDQVIAIMGGGEVVNV